MRGAAGRHGAPAVTRVATRARRVGVEGYRGPALAAALVVPAPPAKPRRATGSATTAAPRSPDTATARTSSGARAVTNVSKENRCLPWHIHCVFARRETAYSMRANHGVEQNLLKCNYCRTEFWYLLCCKLCTYTLHHKKYIGMANLY